MTLLASRNFGTSIAEICVLHHMIFIIDGDIMQAIVSVVLVLASIPLAPGYNLSNQTASVLVADSGFDRIHCGNLTFEYFRVGYKQCNN